MDNFLKSSIENKYSINLPTSGNDIDIGLDYKYIISSNTIIDKSNFKLLKINKKISLFEIESLLNFWRYRSINEIPFIDDTNEKYFNDVRIIEDVTINLDGNSIMNNHEKNFLYNGIKYEHYSNNFQKNIISLPFSLYPNQYRPSGHLNLDEVNKCELVLETQNNSLDTINYNFNLDIILNIIKFIKIENNVVTFL